MLIGCLLAVAVVQYDGGLKLTRFGPLAMAWCRILNVLLGASIAVDLAAERAAWLYALGIGAYTMGLTYVARSEAVGAVSRMSTRPQSGYMAAVRVHRDRRARRCLGRRLDVGCGRAGAADSHGHCRAVGADDLELAKPPIILTI